MDKQNEDEAIYADEATLFFPNQTKNENIQLKLHNYNLVTQTRKLKIQWDKVLLMTNVKIKYF